MNMKIATPLSYIIPIISGVLILVALNLALYGVLPPTTVEWYLPASRSFRLDFDQSYYTNGFYGAEFDRDQLSYAWTSSPQALLHLPILARNDLKVIFALAQAIDDDYYNELTLRVGETPIALTQSETHLYSGVIPSSAFGGAADRMTLIFTTPDVMVAQRLDPLLSDTRALGIAFDWLTIQPMTETGRNYEFDDATPVRDDHWYGPEIIDDTAVDFRWSGVPSADMTIQLPLNRAFTLEVGVIDAMSDATIDSFALLLNGAPLPLTREDRDSRHIFTASVPPQTDQQGILTFRVPDVRSPAEEDPQSQDNRPLGVSVDWVHIEESASSE